MSRITKSSLILFGFLMMLQVGCADLVIVGLINAPNKGKKINPKNDPGETALKWLGIDRQYRVAVGPPDASLLVWVIDPPDLAKLPNGQPRGTVIVMHGYRNEMFWMRGVGQHFAKAGFRAVTIDLRGHGHSSGDYMTYGVVEARDLVQVIDYLEGQQQLVGKVGVWGISMGAVTAIRAAAIDSRIVAVAAVAPFTTLRSVVPNFTRNFMPIAGHLMSEETIQKKVDEAGIKAGFDPDESETIDTISRIKTPVLIMHGKNDAWVPAEQARMLHKAAPDHTELVLLNWTGHVSAHFDIGGGIKNASIDWFNRHLIANK